MPDPDDDLADELSEEKPIEGEDDEDPKESDWDDEEEDIIEGGDEKGPMF